MLQNVAPALPLLADEPMFIVQLVIFSILAIMAGR
jgi:hypothetical protein